MSAIRSAIAGTGRIAALFHWTAAFWMTGLLPLPARSQGSWEIGYSFDAPSRQTNGLGWDGQALWHTHDRDPIIYRLNPDGGAVLDTKPTQVPDQGDAEIAGGFLWVASENDHYVHQIDLATGRTVDTIKVLGITPNPPGTRLPIQLEGVAFDGRNLWVSGDNSSIVKIDLKKGTQHLFRMPREWGYLDGMTWAFDHLWVVTNNSTIYEIDPCSMGMLDFFAAPSHVGGGPEGFTFDGENLWFGDNDLDKIYKIILKDKILTAMAPAGACEEGILLSPTPTVGLAAPGGARKAGRRLAAEFPAWGTEGRGPGIRYQTAVQGPARDALGRLRASRLPEAR